MKKSQRYIRATFIALSGLLVAFIIANRFVEPPRGDGWPVASTPEQLAELRDFFALRIGGDFDVTVEQGDGYRVSFQPGEQSRSYFRAIQQGDLLLLEGYGHRSANGSAQVHVVLPALRTLTVDSGNGAELVLVGISTPAQVAASSTHTIRLVNVTGVLQLDARAVQNIVLDTTSAANSTMTISSAGTRVTTSADPVP